jgi:L-fuconolactonase
MYCYAAAKPDLAALRASGGELLVRSRHLVHSEPDPGRLNRPEVHRGPHAVGTAARAYRLRKEDL